MRRCGSDNPEAWGTRSRGYAKGQKDSNNDTVPKRGPSLYEDIAQSRNESLYAQTLRKSRQAKGNPVGASKIMGCLETNILDERAGLAGLLFRTTKSQGPLYALLEDCGTKQFTNYIVNNFADQALLINLFMQILQGFFFLRVFRRRGSTKTSNRATSQWMRRWTEKG